MNNFTHTDSPARVGPFISAMLLLRYINIYMYVDIGKPIQAADHSLIQTYSNIAYFTRNLEYLLISPYIWIATN